MVQAPDGTVVAVCHLRRGSVRVRQGEAVGAGQLLGHCGNSGNSTEPHVHLQAMDGPDASRAGAVAITFGGRMPVSGEVVEVPAPPAGALPG
jgi:murein DD-endopeptidase MepM/ murein hydrolase activator NlpD